MCDCDCIQNPYYQDLVIQKACDTNRLAYVNTDVYPETQKCSPCQNRDNYKPCNFPTWGQFDKMDCTFKGLNRTYGKVVPPLSMDDVMLPGCGRALRAKTSASESRLRRVPCKKNRGSFGGRASDTQIGGKSGGGKWGGGGGGGSVDGGGGKWGGGKLGGTKWGGGGKSGHSGKSGHPGKGGRGSGGSVSGGSGGLGSGGKTARGKGSKKGGDHGGKKNKNKGRDHSKSSSPGDELSNESDADGTMQVGGASDGVGLDADQLNADGEGYLFSQALMNSGVLTLTPLLERDGEYFFNFNIKNQKPNPDLNLDINLKDGVFEDDNKLTTEIRYRLVHTFDEAM